MKKLLVVNKSGNIEKQKLAKIRSRFKNIELVKCEKANKKLGKYKYIFICKDVDENLKNQIIKQCVLNDKEIYIEDIKLTDLLYKAKIYNFDDIITIRIKKFSSNIIYRIVKRVSDIVFSLIALIITFPIMILTAILIKIDSEGSILYKQKRLTKNGKEFNILKFRTMIQDAEKSTGPMLAVENDERITKVGRVLRRYKIDELPQFLNVLKGDMSIVGPRPERRYFSNKAKKVSPEFVLREKVNAGITCLAHVIGNSYTSFDDRIIYDIIYIQNKGIFYDIYIILMTVKKIFFTFIYDVKKKIKS